MKVEDYLIKDWEERETGVFLKENEDWILIKSIPVDFQVDGYKLLRKKYLKERRENTNKSLKKVLELKRLKFEEPVGFKFMSPFEFLKWSEKEYGCFEFQDDIEDELFYGVIQKSKEKSFFIDFIKSDGTVDLDFDFEFSEEDIRVISFGSDYFESISLLYKSNKLKSV
ncbi:hypothetical protein [uncultured Tenacibaculum sp.]|uniref:hypothetical protein n=1 Tax=uncultured Tenacibaculum sp. TaxID=174713 RepID=UPI002633D8B6|nr:hypothetical protein [uncultured Tenacibaculum sp.]